MTCIPYLVFTGNAEQAMQFYETVFEGTITMKQRFSEAKDSSIKDSMKSWIMHGSIKADGIELFFSDSPEPVWKGNNITLCVMPDSEAETNRLYKALGESGKIHMELQKTFWNALYANVEDKFGVMWQLNYQFGPM